MVLPLANVTTMTEKYPDVLPKTSGHFFIFCTKNRKICTNFPAPVSRSSITYSSKILLSAEYTPDYTRGVPAPQPDVPLRMHRFAAQKPTTPA